MVLGILRRVAVLVASLMAASIVVFGFMQVLPGDPARVALGTAATDEAVAQMRREFGLDRPLLTQYLSWIGGLLRGDLGVSYLSRDLIGPQVADKLAVTLWLVAGGMLVAVAVAVPFGLLMAVRHGHLSGTLLSALSQVGVAVPAFLAGIVLVTLFAVTWRILPAGGWVPPADSPSDFLRHLILPALSLGLVQGAVLTRYVRSAVLDVLREDYVRTARSKGLTPWRALVRHGLRNAAIPVVTVLGLQLATVLVGAVVVEQVFVVPGLGSLLLNAVGNRDLVVVQDVVMVLVAAVLLVTFLVDLLYLVIDPRMRVRAR